MTPLGRRWFSINYLYAVALTLPAYESHIILQSLIVLEKIKSGEVSINEVSQASKPIVEVKPKVTVKYIDCPVCKCKLREKNLEKHLEKVHPRKSQPKKLRESKKKVDMLDSLVMVSGSFGSGKRR